MSVRTYFRNRAVQLPVLPVLRLTVLLLLPAVVSSCHKETPKETRKEQFVMSERMLETSQMEKASLSPLTNVLQFYGKITADNNKMIEVYPVVGGNVSEVFVELGDYVKKNQLLATIRSTEVAEFERELEDAQNDVLIRKNAQKVAQELFEGKLNTERDVLEAKAELEKAESQLKRIQETYNIYNIRKGAIFEVRSPINGFVIQKNINQNMLLRNDRSDNIFDIADIENVWAIANVNESEINQVKLGMEAEVTTLSYPDKVFSGKIDKIFNTIDPETKAMKVRIVLKNDAFLLKPEMRATIRLSYTEGETRLIAVPSSAVIFDKSKYFVIVFHSKSDIETRPVEVLRQVGDRTFLSSGLKEGETVLSSNQLLIYDALND